MGVKEGLDSPMDLSRPCLTFVAMAFPGFLGPASLISLPFPGNRKLRTCRNLQQWNRSLTLRCVLPPLRGATRLLRDPLREVSDSPPRRCGRSSAWRCDVGAVTGGSAWRSSAAVRLGEGSSVWEPSWGRGSIHEAGKAGPGSEGVSPKDLTRISASRSPKGRRIERMTCIGDCNTALPGRNAILRSRADPAGSVRGCQARFWCHGEPCNRCGLDPRLPRFGRPSPLGCLIVAAENHRAAKGLAQHARRHAGPPGVVRIGPTSANIASNLSNPGQL